MATNNSRRTPEMAQSRQSQIIINSNTPTFPISAYLPEKRSSRHDSQNIDDRKREVNRHRTSGHQGSQSSEWSKESEKGRDSIDLGRPMSEDAVSLPLRTVMSPARPESLAINTFPSSNPTSPRSGHDRLTHASSRTMCDGDKFASPLSPTSRRSRLDSVTSILEDNHCRCRRNDSEATLVEERALTILMYLSFPNILVSFLLLVWTLVAILSVIVLSPFRICSSSATVSQSLTSFLVPPLRLQHALIYSARLSPSASCRHHNAPRHASHHSPRQGYNSQTASVTGSPPPFAAASLDDIEYNLGMLVLVQLLSPLVAIGVAFATWTAAVFWFYAAILGDPSGSDKPMGYNDGKSSVLGVRAWWSLWLARPVKGK